MPAIDRSLAACRYRHGNTLSPSRQPLLRWKAHSRWSNRNSWRLLAEGRRLLVGLINQAPACITDYSHHACSNTGGSITGGGFNDDKENLTSTGHWRQRTYAAAPTSFMISHCKGRYHRYVCCMILWLTRTRVGAGTLKTGRWSVNGLVAIWFKVMKSFIWNDGFCIKNDGFCRQVQPSSVVSTHKPTTQICSTTRLNMHGNVSDRLSGGTCTRPYLYTNTA